MTDTLREARLRRLAERLGTEHRTTLEPLYDPARQSWTLRWYDGPSVAEVRAALHREEPDRTAVLTRRHLTVRALALAAIRETRDGNLRRWVGSWGQRYHLEQMIGDRPHPDRPAGPREEAMLARLLAAATAGTGDWAVPDEHRVFDLVARQGIAWLLPSHELAPPGDQADGTALTPLEYLTSRYATGEHRTAWETSLTPLPVDAAVTAARTDPEPASGSTRAALLLLPAPDVPAAPAHPCGEPGGQ
ncbi:hypothetical protein ACIRBX_02325 [Kitasatospora sp. NPDC096147]|uniref:hypothetical protein n=1 Tax=Kitasatospora sp. NPDC096147 TaxID=3364093 RepID=UPI0037FCE22C